MSDYTKTTNFTAKDSLNTGDPNKLIKGSEFDTEFNALATSSATKANKISSATVNNVIKQTASGDLEDAGYKFSELSGDVTVTTAELNTLDGLTSTTAELNILDGVTATAAELNYCDGVTSNIQTQLNTLTTNTTWDGAVVKRTSAQLVSTGSTTAVEFQSEVLDTNTYYTSGTSTTRLTIPSGVSKVRLKGALQFSSSTTGVRSISIRKGGVAGTIYAIKTLEALNGGATYLDCDTPVIEVTPGDYFELFAYQTNGSDLNVQGDTTDFYTWFQIEKVE